MLACFAQSLHLSKVRDFVGVSNVDWEAVEREYRGGILSLREIAELHPGTNHTAIARKVKKDGWERNLSAKIKAKADALVTKHSVTASVTEKGAVSERQVIETNAQAIVNVRLSHRSGLLEGREIIKSMRRQNCRPSAARRMPCCSVSLATAMLCAG